jgi:hypothetical protein
MTSPRANLEPAQTDFRSTAALITILGIALGLRLFGIEWGLPNSLHYRSYHTDETVMLMHSTTLYPGGLNIFAGSFLPHFYNYGSLQLVLINIATSIVSAYHHDSSRLDDFYTDYLTGRVLTALMGTLTVWALWDFGRRVYGPLAGLLAALFLAITPLHAQHSHFVTVDVPATLWVTLTLLWCARAATDENRTRALLFSGCCAGLAAATKYNCALVLVPVIVSAMTKASGVSDRPALSKPVAAVIAAAAAIVAYLIACPGTVLESALFVRDLQTEAIHVSSQQELWFQGTGIGWWYVLERNLADGLGIPLLVVSLIGAGWASRKLTFGDQLAISFALPYYLVIGAAVSRYARYDIPLLPILALFAGRLLADKAAFAGWSRAKWIRPVTIGIVTLWTTSSTAFLLYPLIQRDPRDRAAEWIAANVPPFNTVGMPVEPWFWSPPISPYFSTPGATGQWLQMPGGQAAASRIDPNYAVSPAPAPFDVNLLLQDQPAVVVMSEYEYFDRLRIHDPSASAYLAELRQDYGKPLVFADLHWLGGERTIDGLPCQDLPHDMLYTSPTVLIFQRKPAAGT